jgi:hypothetical protein
MTVGQLPANAVPAANIVATNSVVLRIMLATPVILNAGLAVTQSIFRFRRNPPRWCPDLPAVA